MNYDKLRDQWKAMGAAFEAGRIGFVDSPEEIILATVTDPEFPRNKQMIRLMLGWLAIYRELIHVERLKTINELFDPHALAILGGIAEKQVKEGDHRWKVIRKQVVERLRGKSLEDAPADPDIQIERKGNDPDFANFGLKVYKTTAEEPRKFRSREYVLSRNTWLKNRLLFGPNLRADVATLMELKLVNNANQAAKKLGCSRDGAYRNWKALEEAGWPGILKTAS